MHRETIDYYTQNADEFTGLYEKADMTEWHALLQRWLPAQGGMLEIGCGSGRDARFMAGLGCRVLAVDASEAFIHHAASRVAEERPPYAANVEYLHKAFPLDEKDPLLANRYDAVVANAVLIHIPENELFEFLYQIRRMLHINGLFIFSVSSPRQQQEGDLRLFVHREPGELQLLLERLGFSLLAAEESRDVLGRPMIWTSLVFRLEEGTGTRPVDQIEAIIHRDRKTATYKIALLRALGEIAQHSRGHAHWHPGGMVSLPLGFIVEKWIFYYWPLIDAPFALPEMRTGERARELAFRPLMRRLIAEFARGGMDAFAALYQSGALSAGQATLLGEVASVLARTIVNGPVTYAGGSLDGIERIFRHQGRLKIQTVRNPLELIHGLGRIHFPAALWRELSLIGHWIAESLVLRWAELSRGFVKEPVELAEIVGRLLIRPNAERDVAQARAIYSRMNSLECVWSGAVLAPARFAVDHVIPFSLWHNNDLWNLLPADPRVNLAKSDRIVTHQQLQVSRDRVIHFWRAAREADPLRFSAAASRTLLGGALPERNWESRTFSALLEAVETVALQRGVERWGDKCSASANMGSASYRQVV